MQLGRGGGIIDGGKMESCHLFNPGRCRLVPLSLSTYRHAAKGFISCNPHSFSLSLTLSTPTPKTNKHTETVRCAQVWPPSPRGRKQKSHEPVFVTVQAAVKWHGRRHNIGSIGPCGWQKSVSLRKSGLPAPDLVPSPKALLRANTCVCEVHESVGDVWRGGWVL